MSSIEEDVKSFGKVRTFLWPIHREELPKFLPMCFMMFFILFNYTILRGSKDALVVSAGGASVIPFLKGYIVFPASIIFVIIYSKLVDVMSRERIFYLIVCCFLLFFAIFAFFIYPNRGALHPSTELINSWKQSVPSLQHFFSIFGSWSYSIYYVLAELWGSCMISLLFWQFANDITKTVEAKRFYAMFGLIANVALILSGFLGKFYFVMSQSWSQGSDDPYYYMTILNSSSVFFAGCCTMGIFRWMNQVVLTNPKYYDADSQDNKPKKKKAKMSTTESFKFLFSSKYLAMIALLVLCYGISMNLIELLWKAQLKQQFPLPNDYNNFMQNLFIGTGAFTILVILFSKGIVQKFGWFRGAIMTPLVILITGSLFFSFVFFGGYFSGVTAGLGMTSLMIAVWLGMGQNILSKGVKYGLFDPTKEMAYIPLDKDSKTKGKAAIDVVGGRLGKAGGGYISSGLMIAFAGGVTDIAPLLTIFIIGVILVWIYAVGALSKLYNKKLEEV